MIFRYAAPLAIDPSTASSSTGQLVVQILLTFGAASVLTTVLTAVISRRKTRAEVKKTEADTVGSEVGAAAMLTGSAVSLLTRMDADMARMSKRQEELEKEVEDLRQHVEESQERERGHVRQLAAYRTWAEVASQKLSRAGIPIDPPPHDPSSFPALGPSTYLPPRQRGASN